MKDCCLTTLTDPHTHTHIYIKRERERERGREKERQTDRQKEREGERERSCRMLIHISEEKNQRSLEVQRSPEVEYEVRGLSLSVR